jgi:hypothetical protein
MDADNIREAFDLRELLVFQNITFNQTEFSSALFSDHVTFTVPASEPYTQLEKMFLMFDGATWIWIGFTLARAFMLIQVVSFMSTKVQKFVFGRDIQTPTLNVASIFLNGAQFKSPGRNFSRFMLMMFIIWSLIIRTYYQSELYKNLQNDLRKPKIRTIDELNEKFFTLWYLNNKTTLFQRHCYQQAST